MTALARQLPMMRGFLLPVSIVVVAEVAGRLTGLDSLTVALPSHIVVALGGALADGSLVQSTAETLLAVAAGVAIGTCLGLALGLLLGLSRSLDRLLAALIELLRPIPTVALIPLVILVAGLGFATEITIVAFGTMWPVFVISRSAILGVEPRLFEVAEALGFSWLQRIRKFIMPSIAPRVFLAFRLAVGFALIIAVTVEITTNPLGLGNAMVVAQNALNPALTLAVLIWIGFIGWALSRLLFELERFAFPAASSLGAKP
ncbi:ABC transporter permease subunit [Tardiphaga alba]|uniref:ABC transporter permease subunit n=1 Tax=Tardiphaga alba TaxID=340268 RepID=A0ABX8AHX3_9BRAD|nr:ABC transporter permease subunit [Tardiphaga alba]QUS41925.1 ABC transporter permease subunit [Tardiphaga alba]